MSKGSKIPSQQFTNSHKIHSQQKQEQTQQLCNNSIDAKPKVKQKLSSEVKLKVIKKSALRPPGGGISKLPCSQGSASTPTTGSQNVNSEEKPSSLNTQGKRSLPQPQGVGGSSIPSPTKSTGSKKGLKSPSWASKILQPKQINVSVAKKENGNHNQLTADPSVGSEPTRSQTLGSKSVGSSPTKGLSRTLISYKSSLDKIDPGEEQRAKEGKEENKETEKEEEETEEKTDTVQSLSLSEESLGTPSSGENTPPSDKMGRPKDPPSGGGANDNGATSQDVKSKTSKPTSRLLAMKNRLRQAQKKKDDKEGAKTKDQMMKEPPLTIKELTSSPTDHRLGRLPRSQTLDAGSMTMGNGSFPLQEGERLVNKLPRSHTINSTIHRDEEPPNWTHSSSDNLYGYHRRQARDGAISASTNNIDGAKSASSNDLYGTVRATRMPLNQGHPQPPIQDGPEKNSSQKAQRPQSLLQNQQIFTQGHHNEMPVDVEMLHPNPRASRVGIAPPGGGTGAHSAGGGHHVMRRSQTTQGYPHLEQIPESEQLSYHRDRQVRSGSTDRLLDERRRAFREGDNRGMLHSYHCSVDRLIQAWAITPFVISLKLSAIPFPSLYNV